MDTVLVFCFLFLESCMDTDVRFIFMEKCRWDVYFNIIFSNIWLKVM